MLVLPFQLPFQMLGWSTQWLTGAGQGLQRLGGLGGGSRSGCSCQDSGSNRGDSTGSQDWRPAAAQPQFAPPPPPAWQAPAYTPPPPPPQISGAGTQSAADAVPNPAETTQREEKDMACDQDLSGTDLKIIEYTIVSVDPNIENDAWRVIQSTQTVATTQDMTENGFTAWVIALFFQRPSEARTLAEERFGKVDRAYAEERLGRDYESWKQYLRVCYCVQCRMAIPETDCCQEQANALRDINRTLKRIARDKEEGGGNLPAKTR
jgi:hypothetical protein